MKNVYDIRYEKKFTHILTRKEIRIDKDIYQKTVIILYMYYLDELEKYYTYIDKIPFDIKLVIISSNQNVLDIVSQHNKEKKRENTEYRLKENRGRDISALLITAKDLVENYDYVCFVHDKKEHSEAVKEETDLWVENLWGNLLEDAWYVNQILNEFETREEMGLFVPPEPIGDHFCTWYGFGWHGAFEAAKAIAEQLNLEVDMSSNKPPIAIGTALWFRSKALKKLFDAEWKFEDFHDEKLGKSNYLSYGIERIFPFVAQDAGYCTGTIMTCGYAEKQMSYIQYAMNTLFFEIKKYFPFVSVEDCSKYERNIKKILEYARTRKRLYLYGAGNAGRFCLNALRENMINPQGFLITQIPEKTMLYGLPVYSVCKKGDLQNTSIIITVMDERIREEIVRNLKENNINDFIEFWE